MGPDGEIWAIPLDAPDITTVLYMNEELVKSLGFSIPHTYKDMKAMVPAARSAGLEVVTINGADGWAWGDCLMSCIIARISGDAHYVRKSVRGEAAFNDAHWVAALALLKTMVSDGVISKNSIGLDYGANLANYGNKKALFCVQGQRAAGRIKKEVRDTSLMLAWPELPGEKPSLAGSVAAVVPAGYGLTKKGGNNAAVRDTVLRFLLEYFYAEPEATRRLRDGAIAAPILKDYRVPEDLPPIVKRKVELARKAINTDVIDVFLSGAANDALNAGMRKIVRGEATPEQIANEVEGLVKR
jgi:raffinose/stachyose/melibiose transport system substrate-binding protein